MYDREKPLCESIPLHRKLGRLVGWIPFALAGYLVLRTLFGPILWPLCTIEPLLWWLCLPSAVLLVLALLRRCWSRTVAHAVILSIWLWLFGHLLVAPQAPAAPRGPTLRVLGFNLGAGVAAHEQILELLRSVQADVVLLQELTLDEEGALGRDLVDLYPHRDLHGLGIDGLGVFSRFPLLECELFRLDSRRPYQRVVLDSPKARTAILNVHPSLLHLLAGPWSPVGGDLEQLAQQTVADSPALLAGDFNATENMQLAAQLQSVGLSDAFREAGSGLGLTFPVFLRYRGLPIPPAVRIDYVWTSAAFLCRSARVLPDAGSDHYPLLVELEWR